MIVKCNFCGADIDKRASAVKAENFCNKECRKRYKSVTLTCEICGKSFTRLKCALSSRNFCSLECSKVFTSKRMTAYNILHNPEAMTEARRTALRLARLNTGRGVSYEKTFGRHTHRVVAEQKLGRPLKPGEVVHHIDRNKRNNSPENLMVFSSQAEHSKWHKEHDL